MNRREFVLVLAGVMTAWSALRAQRKAMPAIGFLSSTASPSPNSLWLRAFHQGLSETGWVEGQNVTMEYRWAEGRFDRLPAMAADFVSHKVDLIVADGTPTALAAKDATATIPIVFATVADPVGSGLSPSLARPGGNLTGFSNLSSERTPKRFELLSELVPQASVIAVLVNPKIPIVETVIREMQEAVLAKRVQLQILRASTASEIDAALASLVELHAGGLVVSADPFFNNRPRQLVELAVRHAIPASYEWREWAALGGLISYGTSLTSISHQTGLYAGRILKGEKPADLPVQQPTTFELVVNLKTAKTLGLTVPPSIFARADEVIE